jgi:hypothetical protein
MIALAIPALDGLQRARQVRPGSWVGRCPSHEDRDPSLSWTVTEDGKVLLHCHAGCPPEAIVSALGLEMADLFTGRRTNGRAALTTIRAPKPGAGPRATTRRFEWRDVDGRAWMHSRPEDAAGRSTGPMTWQAGVKLSRLLPYGSEHVHALPAGEPVFLVEGEATAESLRTRGLAALATCGVGYRPDPDALSPLAGRNVILWPDADEAGQDHMLDMADRLRAIAAALRWSRRPTTHSRAGTLRTPTWTRLPVSSGKADPSLASYHVPNSGSAPGPPPISGAVHHCRNLPTLS